MKLIRLATCLAALAALTATAMAQNAPPMHVRGTIASVDGNTMTVTTREGPTAKITMAQDWGVLLVSPVTMADIKQGSFIGAAAMSQKDGTLKAMEVLVFPEAARGTGEGHYPWDLMPESNMTNATVSAVVQSGDAETLTVTYKDGTQKIMVPKGVPIVTFAPADRAMAKAGAKVFLTVTKGADGNPTAARALVGKDGLTPPM